LKVSTVRQDLTSDGSEFQVCGAATEKDRRKIRCKLVLFTNRKSQYLVFGNIWGLSMTDGDIRKDHRERVR